MSDATEHCGFMQAERILITGGHFSQTIYQEYKPVERNFEHEATSLQSHVLPAAFHNSYEHSFPKGHPLTPEEKEIVAKATQWAMRNHARRDEKILHLDLSSCVTGPCVAQRIAEAIEGKGRLGGSFFSRPSMETAMDSRKFLAGTLAHQLRNSIPSTESEILGAIRSDPFIFSLNTEKQMERLVLEPLLQSKSLGATKIFVVTIYSGFAGLEDVLSSIRQSARTGNGDYAYFLVLDLGPTPRCEFAFDAESKAIYMSHVQLSCGILFQDNLWAPFFFLTSSKSE